MAYVNIFSLVNLPVDVNQNNFFDLFIQHYSNLSNLPTRFYIVDLTREMRLDLVCTDLYGSISNLQMLMKINNIDNPFSIKEGDILYWVESKDVNRVQTVDPKIVQDTRDALIAAFKASTTDPVRNNYLKNRGADRLPPNIIPNDAPKIQIDNNRIIVGANLFQNPNQIARTFPTETTSSLGQISNGVESVIAPIEEDVERVLVRRFIRSGGDTQPES